MTKVIDTENAAIDQATHRICHTKLKPSLSSLTNEGLMVLSTSTFGSLIRTKSNVPTANMMPVNKNPYLAPTVAIKIPAIPGPTMFPSLDVITRAAFAGCKNSLGNIVGNIAPEAGIPNAVAVPARNTNTTNTAVGAAGAAINRPIPINSRVMSV